MNPNNQPAPYSVDYLNSISSSSSQNNFNSKYKLIAIILGGLILLAVGLMILSGLSGGNTAKVELMSARLKTIETISTSEQTNLQSSRLRASNTSLNIYIKNVNKSLKDLAPFGVKTDKLPKSVLSKEKIYSDELKTNLSEAKLNGIYDTVYVQEMTLALGLLIVDMQSLSRQTPSGSFKTFLDETVKNLQTTSDTIKKYNVTT